MELNPSPAVCVEPQLSVLLGPYCFDELADQDRQRFEAHLLTCARCWRDAQRLGPHVDVLRSDPHLAETVLTPESLGVWGMSGSLDLPFAGHRWFAVAGSALYALLFAVPVIVEVAYRFDLFGRRALVLAPLVFLWIFGTTVAGFWLDVRGIRAGTGRFWRPLAGLAGATLLLCAVLLPLLPVQPTVAANFQTYPVRLGYLKSVFYAWLIGPWLMLWPFHFVVSMQARLARGGHAQVLRVLNRDKATVAPRGLSLVPVWVVGCYAGALAVYHVLGVSHLFDNLRPSAYMSLFMTVVLMRVGVSLGLAAAGGFWYAASLAELKRECLVVAAFARRTDGNTPGLRQIDSWP